MRNTEISHILHAAESVPWAILPAKLAEIRRFLYSRTAGVESAVEEREALKKKAEERQRFARIGSVAVIPVLGILAQRMNMILAASGGTSTELLGKEIATAVADPDVPAIVLNVDSPGGTVTGIAELHAQMMEAREKKPIVASVNSLAASAAYWLISAATEIVSTPSGEAGSIGVFAMHVDESAALEQEGVKVTLIHAGKYKIEGNSFEPLNVEARASIQADVDAYYSVFVKDVAKGRGISVKDVKGNFGEGRMLLAPAAKAAGMVDRIETLVETVGRVSQTYSSRGRGRKAEEARMRLEMAGRRAG